MRRRKGRKMERERRFKRRKEKGEEVGFTQLRPGAATGVGH